MLRLSASVSASAFAVLFLAACGPAGEPISDPTASVDDESAVDDEEPVVDDQVPDVEGCTVGLCFAADDADDLALAESALASCEAVEPHDFEDVGTVQVAQLELIEQEDGSWGLAVAIADPSGRGAYDYPGFLLEVLDGSEALLEPYGQADAPPLSEINFQGYGVSGCDPFGATFPLAAEDGAELKLKVTAYHDLGERIVDELTFSLRLP